VSEDNSEYERKLKALQQLTAEKGDMPSEEEYKELNPHEPGLKHPAFEPVDAALAYGSGGLIPAARTIAGSMATSAAEDYSPEAGLAVGAAQAAGNPMKIMGNVARKGKLEDEVSNAGQCGRPDFPSPSPAAAWPCCRSA
jgi:hypothetical protein